jgi:hypothetical protein
MNICIVGSRGFNDYGLLKEELDRLLNNEITYTFICGGARGADQLGERYAKEHDWPIKLFLPDWNTHGKRAGFIRNGEMRKVSQRVIAFWDGESRGTKEMIESSKKMGIETIIYYYLTGEDV